MRAVSQLAQLVSSHIRQTNTEISTLRTELKDSVTIVLSEMNTNKAVVATVQNEFTSLSKIIKKGEHERVEEAAARAAQKRRERKRNKRKKEEKKRKEDGRRKKKEDKRRKKLKIK